MTPPKRILAIVNPGSGAHSGDQVSQWLTENATAHSVELIVRNTSMETPTKTLLEDSESFDRIIASGGDGTLMEVVNGLAAKSSTVPMFIVPAGTGNALAKGLRLNLDLQKVCAKAFEEVQVMPLDLGLLNDKLYFALRLSIGFEARVTMDATRELKNRLGIFAYALQALRHSVQERIVRYRFNIDGKEVRAHAQSIWVANIGSLGIGDLEIDPSISSYDEKLDLCIIRFSFRRDLQRVIQQLRGRQRLPATALNVLGFYKECLIAASPRQPIQVDGEVVGETPCRIKVVPKAIQVCMHK